MIFSTIILAAALTYTTKTGCADVAHVPAPNVAYQEGVDSKGWMVAPADINPPILSNYDFRQVPIPLNIPLKNYPAGRDNSANNTNPDLSESWIQPGFVTIDTQTGEAALNGKNLSPQNTDCNE